MQRLEELILISSRSKIYIKLSSLDYHREFQLNNITYDLFYTMSVTLIGVLQIHTSILYV